MNRWGVFLFAFLLYFVSIFGTFVQDDLVLITGDPGMGKWESLALTWTRPYYHMVQNEFSVYRPVTSFSFYVNSLITGAGAWGFRLVNVILYGVCSVLVYEMLKRLLLDCSGSSTKLAMTNGLAFWGAILFAALPIHTEVVNNIVGRGEILSLIFVVLAVLTNLEKKWDLSALFLFVGLMSKESAIVGVPILIYLIIIRTRNEIASSTSSPHNDGMSDGKEERVAAVMFVLMALVGFLFIRSVVLGGMGTTNNASLVENPLKFVSTSQRVMNGIGLIPFGLGKVLLPVNLSYDYSFNQIKLSTSWTDWRVVMGLVLMILSGVSLYRFRVKPGMTAEGRRVSLFTTIGMMFFWVPILVTGNILFPIGTIFGERLWYLPSLGVVMVAMGGVCWVVVRSEKTKNYFYRFPIKSGMTFFLLLILVLYSGRTGMRNVDWLSQKRLFLHDATYASGSVMARSNEAAMYLMDNDMEKGREIMEEADLIYTNYPELLNNWGVYFMRRGEFEKARAKYEACLRERPRYELCKGNLESLGR